MPCDLSDYGDSKDNVKKNCSFKIRPARTSDLGGLVVIEQSVFDVDRISARQYRYLLRRGRATVLVAEEQGVLLGTAVTLFRKGISLARMYSIAVAAAARGRGIGRALLNASEEAARSLDCVCMRSEIRVDNMASQALFTSCGYRPLHVLPEYYEDRAHALRFEKRLIHRRMPNEKTRKKLRPRS